MTSSRPSIVIVGGGIGGLFAANALIAQGLRVSVYEQAPALGEVGAGVYITPNCVRQLQRVGLGPAVEKWGAKVGNNSRYFHHDGSVIARRSGHGLIGLERDLRHASRRPCRACWPRTCRPAWCIPGTGAPALSGMATSRA